MPFVPLRRRARVRAATAHLLGRCSLQLLIRTRLPAVPNACCALGAWCACPYPSAGAFSLIMRGRDSARAPAARYCLIGPAAPGAAI